MNGRGRASFAVDNESLIWREMTPTYEEIVVIETDRFRIPAVLEYFSPGSFYPLQNRVSR